MRKTLFGILLTLIFVFAFHYCENKKEKQQQLSEASQLIQLQLQNVGKLIVTEGTFSQVFTYEDSQKRFFEMISFNKKALVVVNAKVTIGYDLSQIETHIDQETKTVSILYIPKEELNIYPIIEYYDVTQDYFNQFSAKDFNTIKTKVNTLLADKIEKSDLRSNAKNRLISELQKIYLLTNNLGWTLRFNSEEVRSEKRIEEIGF